MKLNLASVVFFSALLLNGLAWLLLRGYVRKLPPVWCRRLRIVLACFIGFQVVGFCWLTLPRVFFHSPTTVPGRFIPCLLYLWNLLMLAPLTLVLLLGAIMRFALKKVRQWRHASPGPVPDMGRRQFLRRSGLALLPAASTLGLTVAAYLQLPFFRTLRLDVPVPDLPPELDGLKIAHVSDFHAGRFIDSAHLRRIAEAVNNLEADLIVFTGDLIDYSVADMPEALDALRLLHAPHGLWICEGNHDLYEDPDSFHQQARESGLNFLFDESRTLSIRGVSVEVIGQRWNASDDPVLIPWHAEAFPILLAHHPHQFDNALRNGIPLTLSGHTHGGQIMLTKNIGCGSFFFRYWSGLYRKENGTLVVSNGAGNWFPLRINAPAEIGLLTLRRA